MTNIDAGGVSEVTLQAIAQQAANQPAPAPAPAPGSTTNITADEQTAVSQLQATLAQYGFTAQQMQQLVQFATQEAINGDSQDQITLDLQQQPAFIERFPAIQYLQEQGLPPITPAQYLSNEQAYMQAEQAAGITQYITDPSHYDQLIANQVSPSEYTSRIQQGYQAVSEAPPQVTQALSQYYGVQPSDLAAYFLDPMANGTILQQNVAAAMVGGASSYTGYGNTGGQSGMITAQQAQMLAQAGVTQSTAQTGFAQLVHENQLTNGILGQNLNTLNTNQQLGAQFMGNQQSADQLALNAKQEEGFFNQGAGVAQTATGNTGIGAVQR